jgi:hypothetical protein
MNSLSRRAFLRQSASISATVICGRLLAESAATGAVVTAGKMQLGLCTYQWARDWDLPTLIANCTKAQLLGVELRTEHKHGVEPSIGPRQRRDVKKRFADSPVTLVGLGSKECFDSPDSTRLKRSIETAKAFLQLSHDCGGSGVKVRPNNFHPDVPRKKTIEQIGRSLNVLGQCAHDLDQQVRLEVHGGCRDLVTINHIMKIADHPRVAVCWNCNGDSDLAGNGLKNNFDLVRRRLGSTLHVHELESNAYPYRELLELLVAADYDGWALLECSSRVNDVVAALSLQRRLFDRLCCPGPARLSNHKI